MSQRLSLLIADDHKLVRMGMRALLERTKVVNVLGEACDGREAIAQATELRPEVVLMDVEMPEIDGLQATREIRAHLPDVRVIMITMHGKQEMVSAALSAGASGYVLKDSTTDELLQALTAVRDGRIYLAQGVADAAVRDYVQRLTGGTAPGRGLEALSPREREILSLIADGRTSAQIASAKSISVHTVDTHRRNLMEKLGLRTLGEVIRFALKHGICTPL